MKRKKIFGILLTGALTASMCAPAFAADSDMTFDAPTQPMTVDQSIVKVGAHAAASTIVDFLGANMVAERASDYSSITGAGDAQAQYQAARNFVKLGVFGTSMNENPDPYLWNYFYNKAVQAGAVSGTESEDAVYLSSVGSPMAADTTVVDSLGTSYTLARRPQITMDTAGGYDELIKSLPENTDSDPSNDYNPIQLTYQANNLESFTNDMYNLADAIGQTGMKTRYEDPKTIAVKYEALQKGLQLYVRSKIDSGEVQKKTVAIIDPTGVDTNNDGIPDEYRCYTSSMSKGTAASVRGAEFSENTTNNIIDTLKLPSQQVEETNRGKTTTVTAYYATPAQLCQADAILSGVQYQIQMTEDALKTQLLQADSSLKESDIPEIQAVDPEDVFTIRANSVETVAGVPLYQGFIYPDLVNPIYGTMYIYQNFWHVNGQTNLVNLANHNFASASLPSSIKRDGTGYDEKDIQNKILEGLQYYDQHKSEFADTKLELTDNCSYATVKAIFDAENKSNNTTVTVKKPAKVTKVTAKNVKGKKIKVTWKKITKNNKGYQISVSTKKSGTSIKATINKNSTTKKTISKLKKGKTYYVKVRAFNKKSGKTANGKWSAVKKVKVTK